MKKYGFLFAGVALSALLAGCATTESNLHTREAARVAGDLRQVAAQPAAPMNTAAVQVQPAAYVGANVTRNLNGDPLPARWDREVIRISRAGSSSFQSAVEAVYNATGIPISVLTSFGEDVETPTVSQETTVGSADATSTGGPTDALAAALGNITSNSSTASTIQSRQIQVGIEGAIQLKYEGKLRGLLDMIATNFNINWEYKGGTIVFSPAVTRVFDVPALPIVADLQFSMEAGTSGASSRGMQSAQTTGGFNIWDELERTMKGIVGQDGTFRMSAQTGQIVVIARPSTVARVATYLTQLNAQLEKQVAISVNVYSVSVSDTDNYSSELSNILGVNFSNGPQGLNWAVVGPGQAGPASSVVSALSGRSDVSTVTSASVTALNGVPVPVQVANTQAYAKSVSVTQTDQGITGSVEAADVTTGFNLHLVPKILGNGSLLLQYGMNISELNSLESFSVPGGGQIQLPNTTNRNFIQQAQIPNGATLVLAGFEQVRASNNGRGAGHSGLWPFGGSRNSSMNREVIVIAITPVVLDVSPRAQAAYAQ